MEATRLLRVGVIALLVVFLFSIASTSVHAATSGNGRIIGQLLNGSQKRGPVKGQKVTLQMAQGDSAQDLTTATTDAQGRFVFDHLSTDKTINYAAYLRYLGVQYTSDVLTLDSQPTQSIQIVVYDATNDATKIAVTQATWLFHEPDATRRTIQVSEVFSFQNLDTRAYVGSLDGSKGKPNALRFSLPKGAQQISLDKGFDGYHSLAIDIGFASDAALVPGVSEFAFSYTIPYTTSSYDFHYTATYPTVLLSVLIPPSLHVVQGSFISGSMVNTDQHPYHLYKASELSANDELHLGLEGLPIANQPAHPQSVNSTLVWLIIGGLLLLAILVVAWFLYRNRQVRRTKRRKESARAAKGARESNVPAQTRQQALLRELYELDKAFEDDKISKSVYHEKRARLKARLRTILSEQEAARK